jgi:hypothetical protein
LILGAYILKKQPEIRNLGFPGPGGTITAGAIILAGILLALDELGFVTIASK